MVRKNIMKTYARRALEFHDLFAEEPHLQSIGNKEMQDISEHLLRLGTNDSIGSQGLEGVIKRAQFNTASYFAGRSGEVGDLSTAYFKYNSSYDTIIVFWPEQKVLAQKPYPLVPHATSFEQDIFHTWGAYFACGGGTARVTTLTRVLCSPSSQLAASRR